MDIFFLTEIVLNFFIGITIRGEYCDDIRVVAKYCPSTLISHEVFFRVVLQSSSTYSL